jgi:hypothetical protein
MRLNPPVTLVCAAPVMPGFYDAGLVGIKCDVASAFSFPHQSAFS